MKRGTLLLAGSGEFTDAMLEIDRLVLGNITTPRVAILPTAAGPEWDWWKWVEQGVAHYKKLGIDAFGVRLRNAADAKKESILRELAGANAFYFSGGDPGYVLSALKGSPVWRYISQRHAEGAILAGSSAGAMMMGSLLLSNIYAVFDKGEMNLTWETALNLVPYTIWPHFDFAMRELKDKLTRVMEQSPASAKNDWLGIDEDTAVIWQGDADPVVMGKGRAHWSKL